MAVPTIFTWLNGISALMITCIGGIIVILLAVAYKKKKLTIHLIACITFAGTIFGWSPATLSFISFLINYGYTPNELIVIYRYIPYSVFPLCSFLLMYVIWDVVGAPGKKRYILGIYVIIGIIHHVSLYIAPTYSVMVNEPLLVGDIYDDWLNPSSIPYYTAWALVVLAAILSLIGFNKMRTFSSGKIKKRAIFIMIGTFFYGIAVIGETVVLGPIITPHEELIWLVRFSMVIAFIFIYIGIKPEKTDKL